MPNTIKSDYPGPINDADKKTLSSVGIDVDTNSENKEDEEKVVDIGAASTDDSIVEKTGIQFVKESPKTPLVNKEDLSSLAESRAKSSADDLEKEFKSEVGEVKTKPAFNEDEVIAKNETLAELLERIEKKLSAKKTTVKEELTTLKKMKDTISHDIGEIKDLEASEAKIKAEIQKIDSIREEVENIEKEFNEKI
jgi:nicotinamide mononucleotide adenylyltransferase